MHGPQLPLQGDRGRAPFISVGASWSALEGASLGSHPRCRTAPAVSGLSRSSVSQLVGLSHRLNSPATFSTDLGWRGWFASGHRLQPVGPRM